MADDLIAFFSRLNEDTFSFHVFIPCDSRMFLLCFSFSTLSYSEKLLTTFCISSSPLACSFFVRKGQDKTDKVQAACCLSASVSRNSLTAQACSNVNRLAIGFLEKSMTAFRALRHTVSNRSITFRNADSRKAMT